MYFTHRTQNELPGVPPFVFQSALVPCEEGNPAQWGQRKSRLGGRCEKGVGEQARSVVGKKLTGRAWPKLMA